MHSEKIRMMNLELALPFAIHSTSNCILEFRVCMFLLSSLSIAAEAFTLFLSTFASPTYLSVIGSSKYTEQLNMKTGLKTYNPFPTID